MRDRWHVLQDGETVTLSRRVPVRWDLAVTTRLGAARPLRLAHQVRQDLWRALRRQRGYAPAVEIVPGGADVLVRAGGRVEGPFDKQVLEQRISAVLNRPENRARWLRFAARHGQMKSLDESQKAEEGST